MNTDNDISWSRHLLRDSTIEWDHPTLSLDSIEKVAHKNALEVQNLTKSYDGHLAVNNVSFVIPYGSSMGLLGGNGAGKTTIIAMIMGLVTPTLGRVTVLGCDMANARHRLLKKMNFHSPYVAMPAQLSVYQNLNVFGRLYGVTNLPERIDVLVEQFGLSEILNHETGRLSAGQKTRVSLAKALLNKPQILLLDEPTASLDPDRAIWIRELLKNYQREHNATLLLSSHNMIEVEYLCEYVAIMNNGRVIEVGTPLELANLYQCPSLEEVFLAIVRDVEFM